MLFRAVLSLIEIEYIDILADTATTIIGIEKSDSAGYIDWAAPENQCSSLFAIW